MTGRHWFAVALGSALIIVLVAYLDTRQLPFPDQPAPIYTGPTTSTATLLTVSGGDQPTFGTSGNNTLVFSSSWTSKTYLTVGPYPNMTDPPKWVQFHKELPSDTMIRVEGYGEVSLGLLRSWAKRER